MSTAITKGNDRNDLARIYDRLRKRSQRKARWNLRHAAYVAGVKDALNAVEEAQAPPPPLSVGDKVRVVTNDRYNGAKGTITARSLSGFTLNYTYLSTGSVTAVDGPFSEKELERI